MAFPPSDKSFAGVLRDVLIRLVAVERRLAIRGGSFINRGTDAERTARFGTPATDTEKAILANQQVLWYNVTSGWWESYYATTGTTGLAVPGLKSPAPAGWYPMAGSPLYVGLLRTTDQAVTGAAGITFTAVTAQRGIAYTAPSEWVVLAIPGTYEVSVSMVYAGDPGGYADLRFFLNGVEKRAETGAVFPHTSAYSRAEITGYAFDSLVPNYQVRSTITPSSNGAVKPGATMLVKYLGPPLS